MERLFDLDAQLLFDAAVTAVCVFIMVTVLTYFLINPARRVLNGRREKIEGDLKGAEKEREDAARLKAEYERRLCGIQKEADEILADARRKAALNQERMLSEARDEAARMIRRAEIKIERDRRAAADEMKRQIVSTSVLMAEQVLRREVDEKRQAELVERTLKEMGEQIWQE